MKKFLLGLIILAAVVLGQEVKAAEKASPIGLALLSPIEYPTPKSDVTGVVLGLVYSDYATVRGLDLTFIASTRENFYGYGGSLFYRHVKNENMGYSFALYNRVDKNSYGLQSGFVNNVKGNFTGLEWGLVNFADGHMTGVQALSAYNYAGSVSGVQIGIVNKTPNLRGLQIGIVNIADNSQVYKTLPIVNFNFKF